MDLREQLAALTEASAVRAEFHPDGSLKAIEFAGARRVAAGVTTMTDPDTGEPVDLSEGAPELAREDVDAEIAARNFQRGDKS